MSDKFLRERPDSMLRFLRATWRGQRFFKTNRKGSVAISAKFLNLQPEVAESVYDDIAPLFTEYGTNSED